jgi:predicted metalloprotease with PDZ domain
MKGGGDVGVARRLRSGGLEVVLEDGVAANVSRVTRAAQVTREVLPLLARTFGLPRVAERPLRSVVVQLGAEREGVSRRDDVALLQVSLSDVDERAWLAHEYFHLWNGLTVGPASSQETWFSEGTAEYYGWLALLEAGLARRADMEQALAAAFERYRRDTWIAVGSIALAGGLLSAHRALVVDGGFLVAACLDADIRRATELKHSLADVIRKLLAQEIGGHQYDSRAIYGAVEEVAGEPLARALARWVEGSAPLALWRCATEVRTRGEQE